MLELLTDSYLVSAHPWIAVLSSIVVALLMLVFVGYIYWTWNFHVFNKLGVKGPKPMPVFGTMLDTMKHGVVVQDLTMRKKYGKVVGTFQGRMPVLVIYDAEMLKQIMIKDFACFSNRAVPPIQDYPAAKFVFILKDEHWKHVRNVMTPAFTGQRLRKMNDRIVECAGTLVKNLQALCDKDDVFDFREWCGAYTMDVIASVAFGLKIDSHNDPNNRFVLMGRKLFSTSFKDPRIIIFFFFPFLLKPLSLLKLTFFPKDALEFFVEVIERAMKERKPGDETQYDYLQLLVDAKNEDNSDKVKDVDASKGWLRKGLDLEEVLAQSMIFFIAGFDTVANTLSTVVYCLATNPDCQDHLIEEIDQVMSGHERPTYDLLKNMPYLEMCVCEAQRMYPAAPRTDRYCKEDCNINGLFIPKGMRIGIPIYAMHHDPDVWPEPSKYIPERFLPESKAARSPFHFMPFSHGPRNCIGTRLALTEMKIAVVCILRKFKFVTCAETEIPLVLDKLSVKGKNGIKLKLERR